MYERQTPQWKLSDFAEIHEPTTAAVTIALRPVTEAEAASSSANLVAREDVASSSATAGGAGEQPAQAPS